MTAADQGAEENIMSSNVNNSSMFPHQDLQEENIFSPPFYIVMT